MLDHPTGKEKMSRQSRRVPSVAATTSPTGRTMPAPLWNGKPTHVHKGVLPLLGGHVIAHDDVIE